MGFVRRVVVSAYDDNILFLGSALTFDALLAALPFALLLLATLGYFVHSGEAAMSDVVALLDRLLPDAGPRGDARLGRAEELITGVVATRSQLSAYGIPLFLWFATRFFRGARAALNEIFDTHESRPFWLGKTVDLGLVIASLVLIVTNAYLTLRFADDPWIGRFVIGLSTYGLGVALFFIVYTFAPTRRVRADTALVAASVAALGLEIAKKAYSLYLAEFATIDRLVSNANTIAVLLVVVWLYAIVCVFLVGGEVAETYDLMRRQREQRAILA
jgi:YihY family inner membrane protein